MHDPLVVAFEIRRPRPKTSRPRNIDGTRMRVLAKIPTGARGGS